MTAEMVTTLDKGNDNLFLLTVLIKENVHTCVMFWKNKSFVFTFVFVFINNSRNGHNFD